MRVRCTDATVRHAESSIVAHKGSHRSPKRSWRDSFVWHSINRGNTRIAAMPTEQPGGCSLLYLSLAIWDSTGRYILDHSLGHARAKPSTLPSRIVM